MDAANAEKTGPRRGPLRFLRARAGTSLGALQAGATSSGSYDGCVVHADSGAQLAASWRRRALKQHGFVGSMSRRGNPYDNARAESSMKT